MLIIIIY